MRHDLLAVPVTRPALTDMMMDVRGVRWRITIRRANGTVTTRRGYESREAASRARDRLTARDGSRVDVSAARYWRRSLADKQP
jgi:hypothetical protein